MGYGDPQLIEGMSRVMQLQSEEDEKKKQRKHEREMLFEQTLAESLRQSKALEQQLLLQLNSESKDSLRHTQTIQSAEDLDSARGVLQQSLADQTDRRFKGQDSVQAVLKREMMKLQEKGIRDDSLRDANQAQLTRDMYTSDSARGERSDSMDRALKMKITEMGLRSDSAREVDNRTLRRKIAEMDSANKVNALFQAEKDSKRDSALTADQLFAKIASDKRDSLYKANQQQLTKDIAQQNMNLQLLGETRNVTSQVQANKQATANHIAGKLQSFEQLRNTVNREWTPKPSQIYRKAGQFFTESGGIWLDSQDMMIGLDDAMPFIHSEVNDALLFPKRDSRRKQVSEMVDRFVLGAGGTIGVKGKAGYKAQTDRGKRFLEGDLVTSWGSDLTAQDAQDRLSELQVLQRRLASDEKPEVIYGIPQKDLDFYNDHVTKGNEEQKQLQDILIGIVKENSKIDTTK